MDSLRRHLRRFKKSVKEFHTKKPQLEFFTALLSIPVLLTVIILNFNNLTGKNDSKSGSSENKTIVITQEAPREKEVIVTKEACEAGIGTISIDDPSEGDEVTDNPLNVDINYVSEGFCSVVWSYRINGGTWSSYDYRSIALYNLPNGNVKFDLRVKSVVNNETKTLTRNFVYKGGATNQTPTPTSPLSPTTTP